MPKTDDSSEIFDNLDNLISGRMDHFGDGISKTADIFLGGGYAPGALGRVP